MLFSTTALTLLLTLTPLLTSSSPAPASVSANKVKDPYKKYYACDPAAGPRDEGACPPEPNDAQAFKCVSVRSCIAIFPPPPECKLSGVCFLKAKGQGAGNLAQCGGIAGVGRPPRKDVGCADDPNDDCVPREYGGDGDDCIGAWALKNQTLKG